MRREVVAQLLRNSILQGPTGGSVQFGRHLEIMHVEIERRPSRDSELYSFYVCNSRVGEKYRSAFSVRLLAMRFAVTRSRLDNIDQAGTSAETVTRPGASLWGGGDCGVYPCEAGVPKGIRTPVTAVKGRCPRPLDDGDPSGYRHAEAACAVRSVVEVSGIEPLTSCMPCKRSPS